MTNEKNLHINVSSLGALAKHGIKKATVAIGVFDGVHKGHQLLLKKLVKMAKKDNATPVAMTFYPHPKSVLRPETHPGLLFSPHKKVELLHEYGGKAVVTIPFTKDFAALSPQEFIEECLLAPQVEIAGICVGSNWRFGSEGKGDTRTLKDFAARGHFDFESLEELIIDGETVSSTLIRRAVSSGLLKKAEKLLGRPYSISGEVERGKMIAGSTLSHPTANIKTSCGIIPPNGVYAGWTELEGKKYPTAIAVGVSPTFNYSDSDLPRVEAHLIDFHGDIYGKQIETFFVDYLREERCYAKPEDLKLQINEDVENIKNMLKGKKYE